jgi:hypothetical protein
VARAAAEGLPPHITARKDRTRLQLDKAVIQIFLTTMPIHAMSQKSALLQNPLNLGGIVKRLRTSEGYPPL